MSTLRAQPDDPAPHGICPACGCRCKRDPDDVARRLLKANAGRVDRLIIARALNWSIGKLERFALRNGFSLYVPPHEKEHEPRGA